MGGLIENVRLKRIQRNESSKPAFYKNGNKVDIHVKKLKKITKEEYIRRLKELGTLEK